MAGKTVRSFSVPISDDALNEAAETINLSLSNPVGAELGVITSSALSIIDNDPVPTLSIYNAAVSEGHTGSLNMVLTVLLSAVSGQVVKVDFATTSGTATSGTDYQTASGTVSLHRAYARRRSM